MKTIVLDTNIVFSALQTKNTSLRDKLTNKKYLFYTPRFLFVEIFKHKERILKNSSASEEDTLELLSAILHHINFINEDLFQRKFICRRIFYVRILMKRTLLS